LVGLAGHVRWVRAADVDFSSICVALLTYFVLSCREELAFHGYPLRRLDWFFGPYVAQLFVATVFALEHVAGGVSWTNAFLGAAAGSLLFGMASLATRGLAVPIGIHAAWNFGSWVLGGKEASGLWNVVIEQEFRDRVDLIQRISYLAVIGIATLAFWGLDRRRTIVDQRSSRIPEK
jgi:membrane protease YdiL (CAAX protease family)